MVFGINCFRIVRAYLFSHHLGMTGELTTDWILFVLGEKRKTKDILLNETFLSCLLELLFLLQSNFQVQAVIII